MKSNPDPESHSMSDPNLVVSGSHLEHEFKNVESTPEDPPPPPRKEDVAVLVGHENLEEALRSDGTEEALEGAEEISPAELGAAFFRFKNAVERLKHLEDHPGVFVTDEDQTIAVIQSALAARAAADPQKLAVAEGDAREAKFDERDVRWALSLITWIGKLRPHPWITPPAEPQVLGDKVRFAVTGDWGTGLYGGPPCAASIKRDGNFQVLVHLGDVYYSGTTGEMQENFLRYWPRVPGALSVGCNGNHEMYSGGYGYFTKVLPDFKQASSCFALQNANWLIVGLDSAYVDHDLSNGQAAWLSGLVERSGGRKLVLLTHHQPFSHFDGGGDKLVAKLQPLLKSKRITAWYWGHEHRCVVYDQHPQWGFFGRCLGHSGYPYFRKPSLQYNEIFNPPLRGYGFWRELPAHATKGAPRAILLDGPNPYLGNRKDDYGPNGYVALEFDGPKLTERYYLPEGTELFSQTIA